MIRGNTRGGKVTNFVCSSESATHHVPAGPDMSRPRQNDVAERIQGSSPKAPQSAFLDQIVPELTETKSCLIVAEARSGYNCEPYICKRRPIAVAILQAEIHDSTDDDRT